MILQHNTYHCEIYTIQKTHYFSAFNRFIQRKPHKFTAALMYSQFLVGAMYVCCELSAIHPWKYMWCNKGGQKSWQLIFTQNGHNDSCGLGSFSWKTLNRPNLQIKMVWYTKKQSSSWRSRDLIIDIILQTPGNTTHRCLLIRMTERAEINLHCRWCHSVRHFEIILRPQG